MTTLIKRTNLSGTSYTVDVTALELTANLSEKDFRVWHGGADLTASYTKTSQVQITYSGAAVVLGTEVTIVRDTSLTPAQTTFLSTTTASELTEALNRVRKRLDELEVTVASNIVSNAAVNAGNFISDEAFGVPWDGNTLYAPTKNAVYDKVAAVDSTIAGLVLNRPFLLARRTAPANQSNSGWSELNYPTTVLDTNAIFDPGTGYIYPTVSGYYMVTASMFTSTLCNRLIIAWSVAGGGELTRITDMASSTNELSGVSGSVIVPVTTGNVYNIQLYGLSATNPISFSYGSMSLVKLNV